MNEFLATGWAKFPFDAAIARWVEHVRPAAQKSVSDPENADWLDCDGTWFIGVDALPNDHLGRVDGSVPLTGAVVEFVRQLYSDLPLHRAQVSIIYPGYPRPRKGEGEAAARYRRNRDAAHVDGLLPFGHDRRRRVAEPHAWIMGIPLNEVPDSAAPMVLWEGSHIILRDAFAHALAGHPQDRLHEADITEAYQAARRIVFETCPRVELPAKPGEAYVLHRHCLHGVAPWDAEVPGGADGRMIAYFRPEFPGGVVQWMNSP